jgi:hypothetical protein
MQYKRKAFPSARREAKWLCDTYGADFKAAFDKWCDEIVQVIPNNPTSLPLVPLEEVLDHKHSVWGYVWEKCRDRTVIYRLQALMKVIHSRKPPFELYATEATLPALGMIRITVIAVVHIDRVEKSVGFVQFNYSGEDAPQHVDG